jgi:type I restriction enzyme, R subunit
MTKLTESAIEDFAIKLFERLGYSYIYAPDIASDSERLERNRYDEVILDQRLAAAVKRINPDVPPHALNEALKEVGRIHSPELLANMKLSTDCLRKG